MVRIGKPFGVALSMVALSAAPLWAGKQEVRTVEQATEAVRELSAIPLRGIPSGLLHEAAGVAILPHVVRAGFIVDREFGRGVVLVHHPDGRWSDPIFVTLSGRGIGGQAGVEATDLVLVFKTRGSLERALHGRLTLGSDVSIAAGLVGREAVIASDRRLKAEIWSYSRTRGLFVGLSLEGTRLEVHPGSNEGFYGIRGCRPEDVLGRRGAAIGAAEALKAQLAALSGVVVAPTTVVVPVPPRPPAEVIVPAPPPPPHGVLWWRR